MMIDVMYQQFVREFIENHLNLTDARRIKQK